MAFLALPLQRPLPTFSTRVGLRLFSPIAYLPMSTPLLLKPLFYATLAAAHEIHAFFAISTGRRSPGEFPLEILEASRMRRSLGHLSIPRLAPFHGGLSWQNPAYAMQQTKPFACQSSVGSRPCGLRRPRNLPSKLAPIDFDCSLRKRRCSRQSCSSRAPQSNLRPKAQVVLSYDHTSIIDNLYARCRVAHGEIALGTRRGTMRQTRR